MGKVRDIVLWSPVLRVPYTKFIGTTLRRPKCSIINRIIFIFRCPLHVIAFNMKWDFLPTPSSVPKYLNWCTPFSGVSQCLLREQFLWHTTQSLIAGEMCIGMYVLCMFECRKVKWSNVSFGWSYSYWHRNIVCLVKASLYNGSLANDKNPFI